ncbi:uncharacterized protein LOC125955322 isoform X2 [Anopheles darlingi]|uniref:uncharacterized protein LOC125955322 isoform X2 n=1 Tax=Anopheles darlingi TaxID=43151 RepID=UPI0021002EA4|nr:uncharacterized protein LOC125955322 isoform X2 [Anopheles darlingi]
MEPLVFLVIAMVFFSVTTSLGEVHDACEQRIPKDLAPAVTSCCRDTSDYDAVTIEICAKETQKLFYRDWPAVIILCALEKLNWIHPNGTINPEGIAKDIKRREYATNTNRTSPIIDMKRAALQHCVPMLNEFNMKHPSAGDPEDTAVLLYMCGRLGATVVRQAYYDSEMPKSDATY